VPETNYTRDAIEEAVLFTSHRSRPFESKMLPQDKPLLPLTQEPLTAERSQVIMKLIDRLKTV